MTDKIRLINNFRQLTPEQRAMLSDEELAALHRLVAETEFEQAERQCAKEPLYWLQNHTATENPHYIQQGLPFKAPFPKKAYFVPLFEAFAKWSKLFIPKTREMMTSWCVMGFSAQRAQWFREDTIVQTESEDKAAELVEYVRQLYDNQPDWLKTLHPVKTKTTYEIAWTAGGRVISIPKGENKIRMYHPTRYVMDEAAFLPEAEACYNAAVPVAKQIIAIGSAGPGWFADECSR